MMKNTLKGILLAIVLFLVVINGYSQERPKLVVGIVVDQMRWDYLYRYYERFEKGGFRRLVGDGFSFDNTQINYLPAFTAVGHTSVYTGSVPSIHGIAANSFYIQKTGEEVSAIRDKSQHIIHYPQSIKSGQISPNNLWTTTITDELRLATNFRSRVVSISLKDRSSVLPAGHLANAAFWLDDSTGYWVSSSYYMEELPSWVKHYNSVGNVKHYVQKDWNLMYPKATYRQSLPEKNNYETLYSDEQSVMFPIKFSQIFKQKGNYGLLKESPFGNTTTREFAERAIKEYRLGKEEDTDFLCISFSATDYIGHLYSANSMKVEDTYLRLDKEIAMLLETLDREVGKGKYLLFLTADHAGGHNAAFLTDSKIPAGLWDYEALNDSLNQFLYPKYGRDNLSLSLSNYQVNLNYKAIRNQEERQQIVADCIEFFYQQPTTAYAVENAKASEASIPIKIKEKIINGYCRERSGEIQILPKPHYYSHPTLKGGTHGLWNPYDCHIPLIFYGWRIPHGRSDKEVYITDIAATIAALLRIQMPSGCIGESLEFK